MPRKKLSASALELFREWGRSGGLVGGKKAAENMTDQQRSKRAKKAGIAAAAARRAKAKKAKSK